MWYILPCPSHQSACHYTNGHLYTPGFTLPSEGCFWETKQYCTMFQEETTLNSRQFQLNYPFSPPGRIGNVDLRAVSCRGRLGT